MPFVKLDCGILNSTLWFERTAREIFITSLLMAEPFEVFEPMPQISVNSLEPTGWNVPPGWYGFIQAAGVGIIHRARLEYTDETKAALASLGDPEVSSRSPEFDGRRLVRVAGGFIVLNFIKYRDKDSTTAERSRRWRERKKERASRVTDTPTRRDSDRSDTIVEVEAEADKRGNTETTSLATSAKPSNGRALLVFPTIGSGGTQWSLYAAQVDEWRGLYPGFNVMAEIQKALAWVRADTKRRKTAGGMPKFLVGWLNRAVDTPQRQQHQPAMELRGSAAIQAATSDFLQKHRK